MTSLIDKQPNRLKSLAYEFTEKFLKELDPIIVEKVDGEAIHETINKKIIELIPIKNEYTSMLKLLCDADVIEADHLIEFFEKLYSYTEFRGDGSYDSRQFDHIKFLFKELYLHTVRILLHYKKYKIIADMVNTEYRLVSKFDKESVRFVSFYFHLDSFEQRNSDLKLRRLSLQADLLYQRAEKHGRELAEADLFLYFVSQIQKGNHWEWYPSLYIYLEHSPRIKVLRNLNSNSHFEMVKDIFNVESKEEFISRIENVKPIRGFQGGFKTIPEMKDYISLDEIATRN